MAIQKKAHDILKKKSNALAYKQKLDNARKWWKKYKFSNNQVNGSSPAKGKTIEKHINRETSFEHINPLHKFASYSTLFTLSALTEFELRNPSEYLTKPPHNIIARSSGIGPDNPTAGLDPFSTEGKTGIDKYATTMEKEKKGFGDIGGSQSILHRNHDIFFENVNITSTVSPNAERNTMSFTKMELELHEPFGITFIEKVRAAAYESGYIDYQDAPYLLTIEWKGFDENGYALDMDPASRYKSGDTIVRRIPIVITRVEFEVNEGGAVYQVLAATHAEFAMMDRFQFVRTSFTLQKGTLKEWGEEFSEKMEKQMEDEVKQGARTKGFEDKYKIVLDDTLAALALDADAGTISSMYSKPNYGAGRFPNRKTEQEQTKQINQVINTGQKIPKTSVNANTSVMKIIEDAMMTTPYFKNLIKDFWLEYLTGTQILSENDRSTWDEHEVQSNVPWNKDNEERLNQIIERNHMIPWFKIITSVHTINQSIQKGIDPITKMYPKIIIFKVVPYKFHILKLLVPGMSIGKVDWVKQVKKRYNYIYTGENIDIMNLRLNYKVGYYHRNTIVAGDYSNRAMTIVNKWTKIFRKIIGTEPQPEIAQLRSYPSITTSRSQVDMFDADPNQIRVQEFFDYLVNPNADMMKIEMEILGDPSYIAQDMYVTIDGQVETRKPLQMANGAWNDTLNCFNLDNAMPLLHLNYRMPADIIEQQGTMFDTMDGKLSADSNLWFSGVYQIAKVESKIDSGKFTQVLYLVRLNNQQGIGSPPANFNIGKDGSLLEKKNNNEDSEPIYAP